MTFEMDSHLFLVSVGAATVAELSDPARAACFPAEGLLLRQAMGTRSVELFIAAGDLLSYADLKAITVLKPVVLPLTLASVRPGRINAELRHDRDAHRLARHILAGLPALRNPAP